MIFRARRWGSDCWTLITVGSEADGDPDEELEHILAAGIANSFFSLDLHIQFQDTDGEWEDLE